VKLKAIVFMLGGLVLGGILGFLVLMNGSPTQTTTRQPLPPTVGSPAEAFELSMMGGEMQKLEDLRGKAVLINFWATWCPPCKEEMPLLDRYAKMYNGELMILGINYEEGERIIEPFVSQAEITFPILLDQNGKVADLYFVKNFPTTFFIDPDGTIRAQHVGLLTEDLLVRYLKTIGIEP